MGGEGMCTLLLEIFLFAMSLPHLLPSVMRAWFPSPFSKLTDGFSAFSLYVQIHSALAPSIFARCFQTQGKQQGSPRGVCGEKNTITFLQRTNQAGGWWASEQEINVTYMPLMLQMPRGISGICNSAKYNTYISTRTRFLSKSCQSWLRQRAFSLATELIMKLLLCCVGWPASQNH